MVKFKNKSLYIVGIAVLVLVLILTYFITKNKGNIIKKYKNDYYSFKYDSTWNIHENKNSTILSHKKTGGKITITYKELDTYLIDVDLKDIISDVIYEVEKQNKGFKLINKSNNENGSFELLYEKDDEESLVYIYKQDNVLLFIYYNTDSKYFDITMESYDLIVSNLKVYSGEKL